MLEDSFSKEERSDNQRFVENSLHKLATKKMLDASTEFPEIFRELTAMTIDLRDLKETIVDLEIDYEILDVGDANLPEAARLHRDEQLSLIREEINICIKEEESLKNNLRAKIAEAIEQNSDDTFMAWSKKQEAVMERMENATPPAPYHKKGVRFLES